MFQNEAFMFKLPHYSRRKIWQFSGSVHYICIYYNHKFQKSNCSNRGLRLCATPVFCVQNAVLTRGASERDQLQLESTKTFICKSFAVLSSTKTETFFWNIIIMKRLVHLEDHWDNHFLNSSLENCEDMSTGWYNDSILKCLSNDRTGTTNLSSKCLSYNRTLSLIKREWSRILLV